MPEKNEHNVPDGGRDRVLRSMTGLGLGQLEDEGLRLRLEVRTVNHKHSDVRVRVPVEFSEISGQLEESVKQRLGRGRAEVTLRVEAGPTQGPSLDLGLLTALAAQLRNLRDAVAPDEPLPWALLSGNRDLLVERSVSEKIDIARHIGPLVEQAMRDLDAMRTREGAALARDLCARCDTLAAQAGSVGQHRDAYLMHARERLTQRISNLLEGVDCQPDAARIEQEIVFMADRSDVTEELTRIESHLAQMRHFLEGEPGGVGRKIDFLLQELSREVNTVGSKSPDVETSHLVVEMKAELERIREQALNVL